MSEPDVQIADIPLFSGLASDQIAALEKIAVPRKLNRGELIFAEGEEAEGFWVIASGQIKIYKMSADGREQILHLFGPGEVFAEVALFADQRYPAHAVALGRSQVLLFPRRALIDQISRAPDLALALLAVMAWRLHKFAFLIEDLSLKEVPSRLAAYFLDLSLQQDADAVRLDVSKTQLAGLLGTIPETLSRILAKMSAAGLIEVNGAEVRLADVDRLGDLAEGAVRLADLPG